MVSGAEIIRETLIKNDGVIVCPGVYDGISARVALEAGAKCLYMTGAGTTASRLGQPDLGIATLNDFVHNGAMIVSIAGDVPVICDADTGFGGSINVARTVQFYERAGIAALHIEDQIATKRCGHLLGKAVVSREDFATRLRAAVNARSNKPSKPIIIARTDTVQTHGLEEAIARMKEAYSIGAEVGFVEGILNAEDAQRITREMAPMPMLLNLATNGVTPNWTVEEGKMLGFKIFIFPLAGIFAAVHALRESYREVLDTGTDVKACKGMTPREFFNVVGLSEAMEVDRLAGSTDYKSV